jgi:signal transduction histidine kinase
VSDHPALQDATAQGEVSPAVAILTAAVLASEIALDEAIELAATHLLTYPRVDAVATSLVGFTPENPTAWMMLGGRAWVREWLRPGSPCSIVPSPDAGPEAALSMPWLSQFARRDDLVVLVDTELLPPEAEQDRRELAGVGVRSLIATIYSSAGTMFGSLSVGSTSPGAWPAALIDDLHLLNAAISSRLQLEHSRRALVEAIEAGNEAQLANQHFFAAVGHELRTPLAAIMGYTEVLMDDAADNPQEPVSAGLLKDGPVILRACEQLVSVVDSLLGAGRAFSNDDKRQNVVVADAIADVVHWHRVPALNASVRIQVDVDPALTVWAHPSAVRQVLTNLVGNAIAHHRPAGGSVHLSAESLLGESGQEMVRIIVRDDGPGLTPDQVDRVFEPFVRFADAATKGSGLGLSISRTIAERDGGAVQGTSTVGVGSSFWLELPAQAPYGL